LTLESRRRAQRDSNPARPGIHSGPEPGPLFRTHVGFGSVADFRRVQVGVHPTPKTDITTGPALVRLGSKPEVAVPIQSRRSTRSGNHGGSSVQAPSPPSSALPAGVPRGQRRVFCEPWPARRRPRRLRKSRDHFIRRSDRSAGMCERVVSYLPLPYAAVDGSSTLLHFSNLHHRWPRYTRAGIESGAHVWCVFE